MYDIARAPMYPANLLKEEISGLRKKLPQVLAVFRKSCTFASQFRKEAPVALQNEA